MPVSVVLGKTSFAKLMLYCFFLMELQASLIKMSVLM